MKRRPSEPMSGSLLRSKELNAFSLMGLLFLTTLGWAETLSGVVVDQSELPLPGVMLYDVTDARFSVYNGEPTRTNHVKRCLTERDGRFEITLSQQTGTLLARDMEDRFALLMVNPWEKRYTLHESGTLQGTLWSGPNPLGQVEITATLKSDCPGLRFWMRTQTNAQGRFHLRDMMPGTYVIQTIEDVPQVGCCFNSVVTHQSLAKVAPGQTTALRMGGTNLPYLHGRLTSTNGKPLHAVWVHLTPTPSPVNASPAVYADVSDVNGAYAIYDIPPGTYQLDLFRRLAQNSGSRVLQQQITVTITQEANSIRPPHQQDIEVNLTGFMPLDYGQDAPPFQVTLLDGSTFDLAQQRGKPVILHFYATYCSPCVQTFDFFDTLQERLGSQAMVVGISLDQDRQTCKQFIQQKKVQHPQIFDGPSPASHLAKLYHLVNIPTTFIVDAQGKIAQIDLFGPTLEKFIREECLAENN